MMAYMDIQSILKSIGLTEKEAKIYLTCLECGQDTVFNLAKNSGLKRPTAYFTLEKLKERGLASTHQTSKAIYYSVISPAQLLVKLEKEKEKLSAALPELEKLYRQQPHKPLIKIFEGREGVELIYRESGEYLKRNEEILYFGSTIHFLDTPEYKHLLDLYVKEMKSKKHKAREILVRQELEGSDYVEKIQRNKNANHQIRYFPKRIKFSETDNIVYGNKVAIFSLKKEVLVILIEAENIADAYRNIFEMMWSQSDRAY